MKDVAKVVCYIVNGGRILVFRQPEYPEAGLQVPAGTIEPGETPEAAAKREAEEETGLSDLRLLGKLGCYRFDMSRWKPEIHERHVFAFASKSHSSVSWTHRETHAVGGSGDGIEFAFSWWDLGHPGPELIADLGLRPSSLGHVWDLLPGG